MRGIAAGFSLLAGLLSALVVALVVAACGGTAARDAASTITQRDTSGGTAVARSRTATVTVTHTAVVSGTSAAGVAQNGSGGAPVTAGAGSTSTAAPAGARTAACTAADLALSFLGQQGATGHGELGFALRNTAGSSCTTIGYPGIQFLGAGGAPLPTSPTHTTADLFGHTTLRPLTLRPGQSASFRLGVSHGAGSSAGCRTAAALQVIAPNDTATLRAAIPEGASECGTATVSPLSSGDSAYP